MPSNLNALIRYKTINSCLYGGGRRWSLDELIEKCSEALTEYRGRKNSVSERTIRDDIRVMRSDILGFNAPIKQKEGLYYYHDPYYSILSVSLTDSGLIEKIIKVLKKISSEVSHPELEILLAKLTSIRENKQLSESIQESIEYCIPYPGTLNASEIRIPHGLFKRSTKHVKEQKPGEKGRKAEPVKEISAGYSFGLPDLPSWGDVMGLIRPQ